MKKIIYLILIFMFLSAADTHAAPRTKNSQPSDDKVRVVISLKLDETPAAPKAIVIASNLNGAWEEVSVPRFLTDVYIYTKEITPGEYEFNFQIALPSGVKWAAQEGKISVAMIEVNGARLDETFVITDKTNGRSNFSILVKEDGSIHSGTKEADPKK